MRDVESGAPRRDVAGAPLAPRGPDPNAARLFTALQIRPGHALVVGEHAAVAEELFTTVDAQLACYRRLRIRGRGLNPEAVVRTIGADFAGGDPPPSLGSIMTSLAAEARAAGVPVVVVVSGAEDAGVRTLERLRRLLEAVPEAHDVVRLVLLGGPRLLTVLAQPEARRLSARLATTIYLPPSESGTSEIRTVLELPEPLPEGPGWRRPRTALALVLGALALFVWWATHDGRQPATPPAAEAPATPPVVAALPETSAIPPEIPPEIPHDVAPAPAAVEPTDVPSTPTTSPPKTAPVAPSHRESLQVGSFLRAENAEALRARLAQEFKDVEVVAVTRGGIRYHTVRIRAANERQLATRAAALRGAGFTPVRVRD
jgi:DedD protein